jgi:hypothetical protein
MRRTTWTSCGGLASGRGTAAPQRPSWSASRRRSGGRENGPPPRLRPPGARRSTTASPAWLRPRWAWRSPWREHDLPAGRGPARAGAGLRLRRGHLRAPGRPRQRGGVSPQGARASPAAPRPVGGIERAADVSRCFGSTDIVWSRPRMTTLREASLRHAKYDLTASIVSTPYLRSGNELSEAAGRQGMEWLNIRVAQGCAAGAATASAHLAELVVLYASVGARLLAFRMLRVNACPGSSPPTERCGAGQASSSHRCR